LELTVGCFFLTDVGEIRLRSKLRRFPAAAVARSNADAEEITIANETMGTYGGDRYAASDIESDTEPG